jgi:hypothetical protein
MPTLLARVDDEPHTPPVCKIVPHPLHEDEQSVAKANEIHEMNEEPYQPGREAAQVDAHTSATAAARPMVAIVPRSE